MTLNADQRELLVRKLAREVTYEDDALYPELRTALEALVDKVSAGETPGKAVDWAAIVAEATSLRPKH